MLVPNRHSSTDAYRYGFNGKEKDDELKGEGNIYDYGARTYDPRAGRWYSRDPLEYKYANMSPYASFNNSPIYYMDPDGKDGIVAITGTGTKKDPFVVTITANYYYKEATENQKAVMKSVAAELGSTKKFTQGEKDDIYYQVVMNVNFKQADDPVEAAKKDVGINGANYGNVFNIGNDEFGVEGGHANNEEIFVWDNMAKDISKDFNSNNQEKAYSVIFYNVLIEEVLHNLGGLHQDGGAVPPITTYTTGNKSITETEKPPLKNRYSSNNAEAIYNRIDKPLGTDAKNDPVDKKGKVIDPPLRDTGGTVGQVKNDEVKKL